MPDTSSGTSSYVEGEAEKGVCRCCLEAGDYLSAPSPVEGRSQNRVCAGAVWKREIIQVLHLLLREGGRVGCVPVLVDGRYFLGLLLRSEGMRNEEVAVAE